ncbi:MAG: type III-D CRISPR-associated RAMP protein Csx10 [Ktedonobacteraceae bacterium]
MQHFSLQLEALSPLAIRADHAPGGVENAAYISGTTLLGSLAALHRLAHPGATSTFERLFLSGQVYYPDLYPASFTNDDFKGASDLPVYPLPKTAQSCKRFPGFLPLTDEEVDEKRHGVRDSLLDWAVFTLGGQADPSIDAATLLKPFHEEGRKNCPACKRPMDRFSGYYRRRDSDGQLAKAEAETRLQTRTGINRATGTVQESILYSRQVFEEHTRFWGMLHVEDELAQSLQQFISEIGTSGLVRIGTGRSRGMGKAHLSLTEITVGEQGRFDHFKQRVAELDTKLHDRVKDAFGPLKLKPLYFAVTLHSPVIAYDELLRYRGVIDKQMLEEMLQLPADTLKLEYQNASTQQVRGWNELWGMPRTREVAIETGSVFLFSSEVASHEAKKAFMEALFKLEEAGIGRRKAEGFGRICVSDPFHLEETLK